MLAFVHAHAGLIVALGVLAVSAVLVPLARDGVLALRAYRARQTADAAGFNEIAKRAAIDSLTALAATLVLSVEGEVRDLKDPLKPGAWNPATDGPRFLQRVVTNLWQLGGDSVTQLRALQRLDVESTTRLLERLAESQVQKLRTASAARPMAPAEMAALVAEILSDPTASPLRARTLPMGAPSAPAPTGDAGTTAPDAAR